MKRVRYHDSHGYGRPIPAMIGARLRLAPAWAWHHHRPGTVIAGSFAVVLLTAVMVSWLGGPPGGG